MSELHDSLVIATQARAREPELIDATVRETLAAEIPTERARYDLVWLAPAAQSDWTEVARELLTQFARRGHRVFTLHAAESPEASILIPSESNSQDPVIPLPRIGSNVSQDVGEATTGARLIEQLSALRRDQGIEAAVLYVSDPAWTDVALQVRERWGWRLMYDGISDPTSLDSVADQPESVQRIGKTADIILTWGAAPVAGSDPPMIGQIDLAQLASWPERQEAVDAAVRAAFPLASIIILTTNLLAYCRLCVASILANTEYPNYEVIIVDNASTDGTQEYLDALSVVHPHVRILRNSETRSFAANNNQALAVANGDVLVLLNDDTMVPPGWLTRFVHYLNDPDLGLIGPATNRTCNEAQIQAPYETYGEFLQFARELAVGHEGERVPIRMLAMFCTAMRRDVFERIGFLDERYEVGMFEDEDYVLRLKADGYTIEWARDVYVHHHYHATVGKLVPSGEYLALAVANQRRFEDKWGVRWERHRPPPPDRRPFPIVCTHPGIAYQTVIGDQLIVRGWTLAPFGVRRVETFVDGTRGERLHFGLPIEGIDLAAAYPGYPDTTHCGFEGALSLTGLADGQHTLLIRVEALDNRQMELPVVFEVDSDALATGRILAFVDLPRFGQQRTVIRDERLEVRGWAWSPSTNAEVVAIINAERRCLLETGLSRPDVALAYPTLPGVEHSGFTGLIPVSDLRPGVHSVTVRISASNGEQVEIAREFEVAPGDQVTGDASAMIAD
jgi:GT2 family glycosyltransferase